MRPKGTYRMSLHVRDTKTKQPALLARGKSSKNSVRQYWAVRWVAKRTTFLFNAVHTFKDSQRTGLRILSLLDKTKASENAVVQRWIQPLWWNIPVKYKHVDKYGSGKDTVHDSKREQNLSYSWKSTKSMGLRKKIRNN